ncbi:MAG: hypothetical protein NVSMB6_26750 [Burkholderiaceae bacterium]
MTEKITTRHYVWIFLALFAIVLIPFALCSPLPLADFPNHAAHMYILAETHHSADLAKYYLPQWSFITNLAMDILVPPLIPLLSPEQGMVLFSGMTLFLIASGAIMVNRALYGRWSLAPFLVFLLLYNRQFLWGILNYLFTVGLLLWAFAGHVHFRARGPVFARVLAFSLISVVLMIFHLHAFACYALVIGCFEFSIAWRAWKTTGTFPMRGLLIPALPFIAPVVMFFALSTTVKRAGETRYSGLDSKINAFMEVFNNYNAPLDIATFLALIGILAFGLYTRRVRIHPDIRLPLAILFATFLVMPDTIFASYFADGRLFVFIAFLLVSAMDVRLPSPGTRAAVVLGFTTLFVVRMAIVAITWRDAQPLYNRILAAIDLIAPGSRVAVLAGTPKTPALSIPPIEHLGNLAVIRKDAFVNSLFAQPGQQPIVLKYVPSKNFSVSPSHSFRISEKNIGKVDPFKRMPPLDRFDYVMMMNEDIFAKTVPAQLTPLYRDHVVSLFKVAPN